MGVLGVGESVAAMLGSFTAGYVFDVFGTYEVMFVVGVGVSIAGVLLAWLLGRPVRKAPNLIGEDIKKSRGVPTSGKAVLWERAGEGLP